MPPFAQLIFDLSTFWAVLGKIALAYVLTLPTAWEREREAHSVGVRTFPITAMASCGYVLLSQTGMDAASQSRVLQGLIAGIGFVGGGAILKEGATVKGTATAASIWNTGAMGAAVALGRYEIAIILSLLNAFTLGALLPLKRSLERNRDSADPDNPAKPQEK